MPLMLISGVIFPLSAIPYPWREWLMWNPVAHGIEGVRAGISPYYHHVPELNLNYLLGFALVLVFLGLVLQRRFRSRLVSL
jgi:capsular polysaccharide transport system permease protein